MAARLRKNTQYLCLCRALFTFWETVGMLLRNPSSNDTLGGRLYCICYSRERAKLKGPTTKSETASVNDVATKVSSGEVGDIVDDANRELRVRLYTGQVGLFVPWFASLAQALDSDRSSWADSGSSYLHSNFPNERRRRSGPCGTRSRVWQSPKWRPAAIEDARPQGKLT